MKVKQRVMSFSVVFLFLVFIILEMSMVVGFASNSSSFKESFSNLVSTPAAQYHNLKLSETLVGEWVDLEGNVLVELQNSYATGGVTYQVQHAKQMTVSIFTYAGTMVGRTQTGGYALGVQNFAAPFGGIMSQGRFSPSTGRVYTTQGGVPYVAVYDFDSFLFVPTTSIPTDTIPYGLQVKASRDGVSYQNIPLAHQGGQAKQGSSVVYETFTAIIPEDTRYLRAEINQLTHIHDTAGVATQLSRSRGTRFAGLTLYGSGLIIGPPETIKPEPEITTPPESSVSSVVSEVEKKEKATKKSQLDKESSTVSETPPEMLSSKEIPSSSPKFEGEVEQSPSKKTGSGGSKTKSSSPEQKAGASSKIILGDTPTSPKQAQEEADSSAEPSDQLVVYQVEEKTKEKDSFSTIVILYIIIACGLVLFLLLRPKSKE